LTWLHQELFRDLPEEDLRLADGSTMVPGELRQRGVAVGRHEAPTAQSLPRVIERWQQVYGGVRRGEASIVALAAAHHRLAWTHPFLDGNGRVTRLHTHLLLHAWGLTGGLWSPLRGFARTEAKYKALLQAADEHRRGDLYGRGNLTQAGLVDWVGYTLDVCIDQVEFMARQLDVQGMRGRIHAALSYEAAVVKSGVREEALNALHYLFATQAELGRADFKTMTGLGERVASATVSALLSRGFVASDSPYGALRFAVPRHALRFYFPALWPEAELDEAFLSGTVGLPPLKARRRL
jgi:Fic family protein